MLEECQATFIEIYVKKSTDFSINMINPLDTCMVNSLSFQQNNSILIPSNVTFDKLNYHSNESRQRNLGCSSLALF